LHPKEYKLVLNKKIENTKRRKCRSNYFADNIIRYRESHLVGSTSFTTTSIKWGVRIQEELPGLGVSLAAKTPTTLAIAIPMLTNDIKRPITVKTLTKISPPM
jgi:hypothetical protein